MDKEYIDSRLSSVSNFSIKRQSKNTEFCNLLFPNKREMSSRGVLLI